MNLEGSLDAFGLPDVFALLAMTSKSGRLRLRRTAPAPEVEGVVWFHDGRVTGASADCSRQGLVRRIVGSGAVDDTALTAAVNRAGTSPVGVARALLEAGAVEPELLREAAVDQVVDAVFDLSRWENGEFGFDSGTRNQDDVGIALDHVWLVAEAKARSEAWDEIRSLIPASDSVVTMPVVLPEDPQITRDEWALLALVDGRRDVDDLVELTGCGLFAVASVLGGLVRRGLLVVRAPGAEDHVGVVERRVALLSPLEGGPLTPTEPVATEPAPSAQAAAPDPATPAEPGPAASEPAASEPASPDSIDPAPRPARTGPVPEPVGPTRLSAAEALAAARLVQGLGGTVPNRPARREVVPERPEPFRPARTPDHPEGVPAAMTTRAPAPVAGASVPSAPPAPASSPAVSGTDPTVGGARTVGATAGNTAMAPATLEAVAADASGASSRPGVGEQGIIERDPSVNRSLLLRLIAGVRGL